jgi:hypothetical protein
MKLVTLAIFFSLASGFPLTSTLPRGVQPGARVWGHVYDNRFGLPVSHARVEVLLEGRVKQRTSSREDGAYEIKDLGAGQYTLSVESPGFARSQQSLHLAIGEQIALKKRGH